jgi:hypothetical protein
MAEITILFADNDKEFLETRLESLRRKEFKVKPA